MSTYSTSLGLEEITPGDQAGLWGNTTNTNLSLIDQAVAGVTPVSLGSASGSTYVLTYYNGAVDESRSAVIKVTGTATGPNIIQIPAVQKLYVFRNSSGNTITVQTAAAANTVTLKDGEATLVFCDGANAYSGIATAGVGTVTVPYGGTGATSFGAGFIISPGGTGNLVSVPYIPLDASSAAVSGILPVANGGTGKSTLSSGALLIGNGSGTVNEIIPGASGYVLTSNGSSWSAQPAGSAILGSNNNWSGTNAFSTTPTGAGGYTMLTTNTGGQLSGTNTWTGQNTFTGTTSFSATVLPTSDGIYNLGSTSLRWNDIYSKGIEYGTTTGGSLNLVTGAVALNFSAYTSIFGNSSNLNFAADNGAGGYKIALGIGNNGKTVSVGGTGGSASWGFYSSLNNIGASGICGVFDASLYSSSSAIACQSNSTSTAMAGFFYGPAGSGVSVGTISTNGSSVAYNTTSDYRLKENVQPLAGAVSRVKALRPVTYNWIGTETTGEGFIAHELQAVVPDAVNGEKDAVDEDGKIKPQAIDPSKIVATLTAALQEAIARIEVLEARVGA